MHERTCDIFCRVVDNFGDAGVCWRLAGALAREHRARVRLLIDHLAPLALLCPAVDVRLEVQCVDGIQVQLWPGQGGEYTPAEIVIEAFGCGLPEPYVAAMAARRPRPVWIVLEYLSAENWVSGYHGLPSPHPRWGTERHFFFPGFGPDTGGLLREHDLLPRRDAFAAGDAEAFWRELGFELPLPGAKVISMFAYGHAPLAELIEVCEKSSTPVVLVLPAERVVTGLLQRSSLGAVMAPGAVSRGQLEIRLIPFLPQRRFDELLWCCDVNFVRGEDSFVRAQWAARPFVWHIYSQAEGAHALKLDAFLELYGRELDAGPLSAMRDLWHAWNAIAPHGDLAAAWHRFVAQEVVLSRHAREWAESQGKGVDLAGRLARFCEERLKY